MGRKNQEQLQYVFSMSLNIMLLLSLGVLLFAETFGIWFLHNKMSIPPGRERAAFWVFQISVATVMSGFAVVPFNASIVAHEKMEVYAYLGIAEAIMRLFVALLLVYGSIKADKLIVYAFLWLIATFLMQIASALYCRRHFSECRFRRIFNKKLFKQLFSFAGWSFMGNIASTFSGQGVNIVLNMFFGTVVNAARGLADTVSRSIGIFVNNFTIALNPQITQLYAADDIVYMKSLVFRGTKFSYYILFLFALPLILEAHFVLDLWLVDVPDYTVGFLRLILLVSLIDIHGSILSMAQRATGDIKKLQIWGSVISFMVFPLSYLFLSSGFSPYCVYYINLVAAVCYVALVVSIVKQSFQISFFEIVKNIYSKTILVSAISSVIPILLHYLLPYGWVRFIVTVLVSVFLTAFFTLSIGCSSTERRYLYSFITNRLFTS